jgi:hypothetical protein
MKINKDKLNYFQDIIRKSNIDSKYLKSLLDVKIDCNDTKKIICKAINQESDVGWVEDVLEYQEGYLKATN